MFQIKLVAAIFAAMAFFASPVWAETGRDVMARVYKQADIFPQSEAQVRLTVEDAKGRARERTIRSLAQGVGLRHLL